MRERGRRWLSHAWVLGLTGSLARMGEGRVLERRRPWVAMRGTISSKKNKKQKHSLPPSFAMSLEVTIVAQLPPPYRAAQRVVLPRESEIDSVQDRVFLKNIK